MSEKELKDKLLTINLVINNAYLDEYVKLVCDNQNNGKQKFKTQIHHIIPRYYFKDKNINLDNTKSNLVNLMFKDHILAHYYLLKCSINEFYKYSNLLAIQYMLSKDVDISLDTLNDIQKEYEKLREYALNNNPMFDIKLKLKHDKVMASKEVRTKISNTMKEKIKNGDFFTKEHREKLSKGSKGRIYINKDGVYTSIWPQDLEKYLNDGWKKGGKPLSKEHLEALRSSHLGKKYSNELRKKLSDAHKGKSPSNKGKPCSEETKEKIRQQILGRKRINNGIVEKYVKEDELNDYLNNGFKLGCLKRKEGDNSE